VRKIKALLRPIKRKIDLLGAKLLFYRFDRCKIALPAGLKIGISKSFEDFWQNAGVIISDEEFRQIAQNRLKRSDIFVYLTDNENLLCYGWISFQKRFYLYEIDKTLCLDGFRFLYDFVTPPTFRKRGYYKTLLANIPALFPDETFVIGVDSKNLPSIRGIEGAGYIRFEDISFCK